MSDGQTPFYQMVRGFPCPVSEYFTKKNIEDAMDLVPEDGDVIIASYPKTGTTWMQYIVLQITSKGEAFPTFLDVLYKVVPYIELSGIAPVLAQNPPRFYKHHFAYNVFHKNPKSKTIYTYRHPEDTVVSFYHFRRSLNPNVSHDFDNFFDHFVSGNVSYGSYFQHVLSFYEHRNDDNLLMVSYEKLHANRKEEILRIAKFLGEEQYQCLQGSEDLLDRVMLHTSFDYMKKNLHLTHHGKNSEVLFFRKGIVGDGKATLSDTQRQILKEAAEKVLTGTSIMDEWYGS